MLAAITGWLTSKGVSLLLGFISHLIMDAWKTTQANEGQREAGRKEVEAAQAAEGAAVERNIAAEVAKDVTEDDVIEKMKRGEA